MIRRLVRTEEKAKALFGEARELEAAILALRHNKDRMQCPHCHGSGSVPDMIIKPGTVYRLSMPVTTAKGLKASFKFTDHALTGEFSKMCIFNRMTREMWKSEEGPREKDPAETSAESES